MNVMKLMVVALAGWISRQEHVIDYAIAAGGLVDCFATTTGMQRELMNYQRFQFSDTTTSSKRALPAGAGAEPGIRVPIRATRRSSGGSGSAGRASNPWFFSLRVM